MAATMDDKDQTAGSTNATGPITITAEDSDRTLYPGELEEREALKKRIFAMNRKDRRQVVRRSTRKKRK